MIDYDSQVENVLFFNSTRTYTLSILEAFNDVKVYVRKEDGSTDVNKVPISFGNYEKSIELKDIDEDLIKEGNYNFLPRMILSFEGMVRASERSTGKYNKFSKPIEYQGKKLLNYGFNSIPYDFNFTLNIQARGLNQAFQIVEQIMPNFTPSFNIKVKEYPLFDEYTEAKLTASDPEFEILDEFSGFDINIINVRIGLTFKSNLYQPLKVIAPIETVKILYNLWEDRNLEESKLAKEYNFEVENGYIIKEK